MNSKKIQFTKKFTIANDQKHHCDMQIRTATNVIWIAVYINIDPIGCMVYAFELVWSRA